MSCCSIASRYRRWLTVLGATRRLPAGRQAALEEMIPQIDQRVLRDEIGGRLHVGVRQLEAVAHQRRQLADHAVDLVEVGRFAFDEQIVPLGADADVEERLEVLEVLVVGAEQRLDPLFGDGDALHQIQFWVFKCSSRNCFASTGEGAPAMRSTAFAVFGKRDHLANRRFAGENRDDPVQPERNAAVRRRAVFERFEEEAEPELRLLVGDAEPLEDARLQRGVVNPDAAAADFATRSARGRRPLHAPRRVRLSSLSMSSSMRRRERMVHRIPPAIVAVVLEQREIGHPQELERLRVQQVLLLRDRRAAAGPAVSTSRPVFRRPSAADRPPTPPRAGGPGAASPRSSAFTELVGGSPGRTQIRPVKPICLA